MRDILFLVSQENIMNNYLSILSFYSFILPPHTIIRDTISLTNFFNSRNSLLSIFQHSGGMVISIFTSAYMHAFLLFIQSRICMHLFMTTIFPAEWLTLETAIRTHPLMLNWWSKKDNYMAYQTVMEVRV